MTEDIATEEFIKKRFDTWFQIAPEEPSQIVHRDIKLFLRLVQPRLSSRILDFGCGTGRHLYALEDLGYSSLFGVDFSSEAIRRAREQLKQESCIKYFCMPFLEFAKNYIKFFDFVVSFDFTITLYPPQQLIEYLRTISSILVHGGKFIAEVWNPHAVKEGKMNRSFVADISLGKFFYQSKYDPNKSQIVIQNSFLKQTGEKIILPDQVQFLYESEEYENICQQTGCTVEAENAEASDISRFLIFAKRR